MGETLRHSSFGGNDDPRGQPHRGVTAAKEVVPSSFSCHPVGMEIEKLGDAWDAGYGLRARCAWGKRREGLKSVPECRATGELDLHTLIWTRGRDFPVSGLASRLKCPWCGARTVTVILVPPAGAPTSMPVRLMRPR